MFFLGHDSHRKLGFNVLREIDLAGNPLRETNIDAVNAQLTAKGQEIIYGFHHEILRLPNGNIATLGWTLKTVDLNGVPTPYAGQLLIVLNKDFQVVWTWDAFDHLDFHRGPILGDVCTGAPCPLPGAVDWLHANSIAWSAKDGNLLISLRHQARLWALAFAAYIVVCGYCALGVGRVRAVKAASGKASDASQSKPTVGTYLIWLGLATCASIMFLATTNQICQDIAVVPFMWVIPLSLYLLSFIICFDNERWYLRKTFGAATIVAIL